MALKELYLDIKRVVEMEERNDFPPSELVVLNLEWDNEDPHTCFRELEGVTGEGKYYILLPGKFVE